MNQAEPDALRARRRAFGLALEQVLDLLERQFSATSLPDRLDQADRHEALAAARDLRARWFSGEDPRQPLNRLKELSLRLPTHDVTAVLVGLENVEAWLSDV